MKVNFADYANLSLLRLPAPLQEKLKRAVLTRTEDVPPDVVTMFTRVVLFDAQGGRREISIVYPAEADHAAGRISVLEAPGTALLGASVGEIVEFESTAGRCRLRVAEILYQPERWMRANLVLREADQ